MRERVGHGEVGRRSVGDEGVRWQAAVWSSGVESASDPGVDRRIGRRRGPGPRPVRPGRPVVAVRPPEAPRPVERGEPILGEWWPAAGPRVLRRRSALRRGPRYRLRRAVGGLVLVAAAAAAVVALGLLARWGEPADVAVSAPSITAAAVVGAPAPVVVTAEPGETVWEVASRVAPELSGPQRAALAERIVADNALTTVRLRPGQVLRVAGG